MDLMIALVAFIQSVVIMFALITWSFLNHSQLEVLVQILKKKFARSVPVGTECGIYLWGFPFYLKIKRKAWVGHFGVKLKGKSPYIKMWATPEKVFFLLDKKTIRVLGRTIRSSSRQITAWDK